MKNPVPLLILFGGLLYLCFQEIQYIILYYKVKKNGMVRSASIGGAIQPHDRSPIYHVKIDDANFEHSIKLKTTILSSLLPRLMGKRFNVVIAKDGSFCLINSLFPMLFAILFLTVAFTVFTRLWLGIW